MVTIDLYADIRGWKSVRFLPLSRGRASGVPELHAVMHAGLPSPASNTLDRADHSCAEVSPRIVVAVVGKHVRNKDRLGSTRLDGQPDEAQCCGARWHFSWQDIGSSGTGDSITEKDCVKRSWSEHEFCFGHSLLSSGLVAALSTLPSSYVTPAPFEIAVSS